MNHPFTRTALILLASSAIVAPGAASAEGLRPNFPIRAPDAAQGLSASTGLRPNFPIRRPEAAPAALAAEDAPAATAPEAAKPALRLTPLAVQSRALAASPARLEAAVQVDEWPESKPELIRVAARKRAPAHHAAPKEAAAEHETYTVRKGDTLDKVADKLGTSVAELKKLNKLKGSTIHPGQKLKGPAREAPAKSSSSSKKGASKAAAGKPESYTVRKGDTLYSIARKTGVSIEELKDANGLGRKGSIHAGQKLRLPGAEPEPQAEEAPAPARGKSRAERNAPRQEAAEETATEGGRTITSRSVTGRVVEVPGAAKTHKVRKGDTLDEVADKLGTSVAQLKKDNRLRGSTIHPGQVLKGPRTTAKAYVAGPGDTLAAVARRFSVTPEALRAANGLKRNAAIRPGQKLRLPSGYHDRGAVTVTTRVPTPAEAAPPPRRSEPTPPPAETPRTETPRAETPRAEPSPGLPSRPQPYVPSGRTPRQIPSTPPAAPVATPAISDAQISELGRGRFIPPVQGEVISSFGPKAGGQRNDGINIRVAAGTSVKAAAAGDVVYAGDQVPGFGNLVLVKHDNGWVTAYGHLSRIDVRMQQKITQGQQLGLAGQTGGVAEPQLHFEVRYAPTALDRAKPVDPTLVLPR